MNTADQFLKKLDTVYHCAVHFITGCSYHVHHCSVYAVAHCPSLYVRRLSHWLIFISESILGLLPTSLCVHTCRNLSRYGQRSQDIMQMQVPRVKTELGEKAFTFSAPSAWNDVQKDLKLTHLVTLGEIKTKIKDREMSSIESCHCTV